MIEYEELFQSFSKLGLDKKRNAFNEELLKVAFLIKEYLQTYNQEFDFTFYNYQEGIEKDITESELLDKNFQNVYYIKSQLMLLLSMIDNK